MLVVIVLKKIIFVTGQCCVTMFCAIGKVLILLRALLRHLSVRDPLNYLSFSCGHATTYN